MLKSCQKFLEKYITDLEVSFLNLSSVVQLPTRVHYDSIS